MCLPCELRLSIVNWHISTLVLVPTLVLLPLLVLQLLRWLLSHLQLLRSLHQPLLLRQLCLCPLRLFSNIGLSHRWRWLCSFSPPCGSPLVVLLPCADPLGVRMFSRILELFIREVHSPCASPRLLFCPGVGPLSLFLSVIPVSFPSSLLHSPFPFLLPRSLVASLSCSYPSLPHVLSHPLSISARSSCSASPASTFSLKLHRLSYAPSQSYSIGCYDSASASIGCPDSASSSMAAPIQPGLQYHLLPGGCPDSAPSSICASSAQLPRQPLYLLYVQLYTDLAQISSSKLLKSTS